ncbi:MAG: hypothetical protein JJ902_07480 [Roseibium sp.]|nr:hypothetical protein [Roseibium sp.]
MYSIHKPALIQRYESEVKFTRKPLERIGFFLNFILLCLPVLTFNSVASAHSPYFGQVREITTPELGKISLRILNGDGIFFGDPQRVVAIDNNGFLLAATPLSGALSIHCSQSISPPFCTVYDELNSVFYEPRYEEWTPGELFVKEGKPANYPEYMESDFGFAQRPAAFAEILSIEFAKVVRAPLATALAIAWWGAIWAPVAIVFIRWRRNYWRSNRFTVLSLVIILLGLAISAIMVVLAAYAWLMRPYSLYYGLFGCVSGAVISLLIARFGRPVRAPD